MAKSIWFHGSYRWGCVGKSRVDSSEEAVLGRWLPEEVRTVSRYLSVGAGSEAPGE